MLDLFNTLNLSLPIAFALTYLLHSTVWILLIAALVRLPMFAAPLLKNYLWKIALLGGIVTSVGVGIGSNLVEIQVFTNHASLIDRPANNKEVTERPLRKVVPVKSVKSVLPVKAVTPVKKIIPIQKEQNNVNPARSTLTNSQEAEESELVMEQTVINSEETTKNPFMMQEFLVFYMGYFLLFWLIGSLFLLIKAMLEHRLYFKRIGARVVIKDPTVTTLFDRLKEKGQITNSLKLTQSAVINSPILIRNQEICLPEKAILKLDATALEGMIAHELAHVARKDYYWTCAVVLLEILFFFQPLHRLVKQELHLSTELLCDTWAARMTGNNLALAKCLVTVASWIKQHPKQYALVASMSLQKSELSNRIQSLINLPDMKKQRFGLLKAGLSFASLLLLTLLILPGFSFTHLENSEPVIITEKTLKEPTTNVASVATEQVLTEESTTVIEKEQPIAIIERIKETGTTVISKPVLAVTPLASQSSLGVSTTERLPTRPSPLLDKQHAAKIVEVAANKEALQPLEYVKEVIFSKNNPIVEGKLPAKVKQTWVTQNSYQTATPFGIELEEAAHVRIELQMVDKERVTVIMDKQMEKGVHEYELSHQGLKKGDYLLVYIVDGEVMSHEIRISGGFGIGKLLGLFGNWKGKRAMKELEKNIPFSGSLSPVKGKLPAVVKQNWVQQRDYQTSTPMGIELRAAADVRIQIKTMQGAFIATVVDDRLKEGKHEFVWPHQGIEKGTYLLSTTVDDETMSQRITVKKVQKIGRNGNYSCAELLRAVKANKIEQVKEILTKVDPNCSYRGDGEPRSSLNAAARNGDIEMGKLLLAANADVEYRSKGDEGALMGAARKGHLDFVKLMLENGADINKQVTGDGTALINAVRNGHYEIAQYLLENGADPKQYSPGDENAIYHASREDDKMLDLVLKYVK